MHCETRREWGRRVFWRAASGLVCAIGGEALDTKDPLLRPSLFLYMVLPSLLSLRSERPSKKVPHRTGGTNFKPCFTAPPPFSTDPPKDEMQWNWGPAKRKTLKGNRTALANRGRRSGRRKKEGVVGKKKTFSAMHFFVAAQRKFSRTVTKVASYVFAWTCIRCVKDTIAHAVCHERVALLVCSNHGTGGGGID